MICFVTFDCFLFGLNSNTTQSPGQPHPALTWRAPQNSQWVRGVNEDFLWFHVGLSRAAICTAKLHIFQRQASGTASEVVARNTLISQDGTKQRRSGEKPSSQKARFCKGLTTFPGSFHKVSEKLWQIPPTPTWALTDKSTPGNPDLGGTRN